MEEDDLVPVFIPALCAILINAEDKKGDPLTEEEVLEIRDNAAVIMMERLDASKMAESREYEDLDPENCWYDWQMLRRELGRKPDVDPGVKFSYINGEDEEYLKTIENAQETLGEFRSLFVEKVQSDSFPLIKVYLSDSQYQAYMWLVVTSVKENEIQAEIFELPTEFDSFKIGDSLTLNDCDVKDWMLNDNGVLYGGYSLRYNRSSMSDNEKLSFDEHLGVEKYA